MMTYNYGNYGNRPVASGRQDYASPKGAEKQPIEQAMTLFVDWAQKNDRNYFGSLVKENLAAELARGSTPAQAFRSLIARAP